MFQFRVFDGTTDIPERERHMINVVEQFPGENEVVIDEETRRDFSGHVQINGRNNRVLLGRPTICVGLYLEVSGGGVIEIGERCLFHDQHIRLFASGSVSIGSGCAFNGHSVIHMHESGNVSMGRDCLIAGAVSLSTSHVHKIIDIATGERINMPGDIHVGDHVWLSSEVNLWAGANVGHDCVVGKGTYVSGSFPPHSIIAGGPAKIIRSGVTWEF